MNDELIPTNETDAEGVAHLEDRDDKDEEQGGQLPVENNLAATVMQRFYRAKDARFQVEDRAVQAYLNYRGLAHPRLDYTEKERSKVFIKVTKTKVIAANALVKEILFPSNGNKFPVVVKPSPLPEGAAEAVHISMKPDPLEDQKETEIESPYGYKDDGKEFNPSDANKSILDRLGSLREKLIPVKGKVKEGEGKTPDEATFHPAEEAARKMDKKMQDQFLEGKAHKALRHVVMDASLYGTGIMKGPFAVEREYPYWELDEKQEPIYKPRKKLVPTWEHVRFWDFYPDPDARDEDEMEWCVIRRKLMRSDVIALKKRTGFRANAVDLALKQGENYIHQWWEDDLEDDETRSTHPVRFEAYEFWGLVDRRFAEENEVEIPEEFEDAETLQMSVWVLNGQVLKASINPYRPMQIPFHIVRFEDNPYNFFGVGMAENMEDTQMLMNGFMRMAIDNAALAGNLVFEVDEEHLVPGQDVTQMWPGKVIRRSGGAMGQAIFSHKFNSTANENMQMFEMARKLADESTGFPSFAHGQTGVQGVGRTASGISMLMGAASTNIKQVIKNFDDMLESIGLSLYYYNMQFEYDEDTIGDIVVSSRGTDSLMSSEIKTQRLAQFTAGTANPFMAPHVKWAYILKETAKALGLDPEKAVNSPEEAMLQATAMRELMMQSGGAMGQGGAQGSVPSINDDTGGGGQNIAPGVPQQPGMPQFSGNPTQTPQGGEQ